MANTKWTPQQQNAIDARGSQILVSAAAGSGKTAVLTERVINRMIYDAPPVDADRMLVVTFTKASASEMKNRIQSKLAKLLEENPNSSLIKSQLSLLTRAPIGTIHSFCLEILKENFHKINLPVNFKIGEQRECEALQKEIIDEILEEEHKVKNEVFLSLADLFFSRRGDENLSGTIFAILNFARANPFYRKMLEAFASDYENINDVNDTSWAKILFSYGEEMINDAIALCDKAIKFIGNDTELSPYLSNFLGDKEIFCQIKEASREKKWDDCVSLCAHAAFSRIASPKKADADDKEYLKGLRQKIKDDFSDLNSKVFCCTILDWYEDIEYVAPKARYLFEMALKADGLIEAEKRRLGRIDFSDLEQMTLELLVSNEGGQITKTELAKEIGDCYDEVMVDEYQDVNAAQEMLLWAVSKDDNRFMVGDVKQSIYRFRQAMPEIFIEKLESFSDFPSDSKAQRILLNGNFRSKKKLTEGINFIFKKIMTKEVGEVSYDETQALVPMAEFCDNENPVIEIDLIDQLQSPLAKEHAQAAFVAQKISHLLKSKMSVGKVSEEKQILPGDIGILLRSPFKTGILYYKALKALEIDCVFSSSNNLFDNLEIMSVSALLKALSNPIRDLELASAMMSPIFNFSDDDMAQLKASAPKDKLYIALSKQDGNSKLGEFLKYFNELRIVSQSLPIYKLISKIYTDTGYDIRCRCMKNSPQILANLNLLSQLARERHEHGNRGLYSFVRYITQGEEKSISIPSAMVAANINSVTISSIHSSKGLEWPVVFLCDTAKAYSFYGNDLTDPYILHNTLGFGCVRREFSLKKQYPTMPLLALRVQTLKSSVSEELRLLYVALTRAKEQLYITGIGKNWDVTCGNLAKVPAIVTPFAIQNSRSYLNAVLLALSNHQDFKGMLNDKKNNTCIKIKIVGTEIEADKQDEEIITPPVDEELEKAITERLKYQYPLYEGRNIPTKSAASKVAHKNEGLLSFYKTPQFAQKASKGGATYGTLLHKFLQVCNFNNAKENLELEIDRLVSLKNFTLQECEELEHGRLKQFFNSQLAEKIMNSQTVLKEFRFMAPANCSPISAHLFLNEDTQTMLEGICDCLIINDNKALIIDYKSDKISNEHELIEKYSRQLYLYRDMLKNNFEAEITACVLYSFWLDKEIVVWENNS